MVVRGLSQFCPVSCATYQEVVPVFVVEGVGAVEDPVPPLGWVYHTKLFPDPALAVSTVAEAD